MREVVLKFNIHCGKTTCYYEKGKHCRYLGSRRFGSLPVCCLFPSTENSFTDLAEDPKTYWIQRCEACLDHELRLYGNLNKGEMR